MLFRSSSLSLISQYQPLRNNRFSPTSQNPQNDSKLLILDRGLVLGMEEEVERWGAQREIEEGGGMLAKAHQ